MIITITTIIIIIMIIFIIIIIIMVIIIIIVAPMSSAMVVGTMVSVSRNNYEYHYSAIQEGLHSGIDATQARQKERCVKTDKQINRQKDGQTDTQTDRNRETRGGEKLAG